VNSEEIWAHIDSFLNLMKFSYSQLPFSDDEPYLYIAKSIESSVQTTERILTSMKSIGLNSDSLHSKVTRNLASVNSRTERLQKKGENSEQSLNEHRKDWIDRENALCHQIIEEFRDLATKQCRKIQTAKSKARFRFLDAKTTFENLKDGRQKLKILKCPEVCKEPSAEELIAKIRVKRIVLEALIKENDSLNKMVSNMKDLLEIDEMEIPIEEIEPY
jgi:hypothetical protein